MKKIAHSLLAITICTMMSPAFAEDAFDLNGTTMTGDWNGTRTELANQGVKFDGTIAMDSSYLADGGYDAHQAPTFATQFGLGTTLDMEKLAGWSGVTVRALVRLAKVKVRLYAASKRQMHHNGQTLKPIGGVVIRVAV